MNMGHPSVNELELYVLGGLDAVRTDALETHVASCHTCAIALRREACLELAFEQVARRTQRAALHRVKRLGAYGGAGIVAVAAAAILWVGRSPGSGAAAAGGPADAVTRAAVDDGAVLDSRSDSSDGG
jgi:hypothetical protein